MTTLENNRLIAEFMNLEILHGDTDYPYIDIYPDDKSGEERSLPMLEYYYSDWNEVMPVVEKCYEYGELDSIYRELIIETFTGIINIQSTYHAVIEYIKWYNKQLKN